MAHRQHVGRGEFLHRTRIAAPRMFLAVLACVIAAGCGSSAPRTLSSKSIQGQVLERGTGKPLEGVMVAVLWEADDIPTGFTAINPPTLCYHVESATTNARGQFSTKEWRVKQRYHLPNGNPQIWLYKLGYEMTPYAPGAMYMAVSDSTPRERVAVLGVSSRTCDQAGDSQKNLYPFLKAIYEEARQLPLAGERDHMIQGIRESAARAALSTDRPNSDLPQFEVNKFMQENLP